MDTPEEVKQRITLSIDPLRLTLRVPLSQEPLYREAGEELHRTLRKYQAKYPNTSEVPPQAYLAMAATDVAVRFQQTHQAHRELHEQLAPRLRSLNDELESLIASSRALIDER